MPEVAATCVDSSTASAISCAVVSPYAPLYAFTLELELSPEDPGVWTEFYHFDTHTFGPFVLEVGSSPIVLERNTGGDVWVELTTAAINNFGDIFNPSNFTLRVRNVGASLVSGITMVFTPGTPMVLSSQESTPPFDLAAGADWEFVLADNFAGTDGTGTVTIGGPYPDAAYAVIAGHIIT